MYFYQGLSNVFSRMNDRLAIIEMKETKNGDRGSKQTKSFVAESLFYLENLCQLNVSVSLPDQCSGSAGFQF